MINFIKNNHHIVSQIGAQNRCALTWTGNSHLKSNTLTRDTFEKTIPDKKQESICVSNPNIKQPLQADFNNNSLKPKINHEAAVKAAKQITNIPELQNEIVNLVKQEAIVVRTKEDAIPIIKEQFKHLKNKDDAIILNINPQTNNGMQKSNTLISEWYAETNNISKDNLITLRPEELRTKFLRPNEFHKDWQQGSNVAKQIERNIKNVETIPMSKVREILDDIKEKSSEEILRNYSIKELASVMKTMNTSIIPTQKGKGYIGALVAQLETVSKDKNEITLVIPDDCSLSGSSMLCDTVKILHDFSSSNPNKKINVVFSPLILGEVAQNAFNKFLDKSEPITDLYLKQINAIKSDGTESFDGIKKAFTAVKNSKNISFELTPNTLKAKHFTDTDYFKNIDNPVIKSELTYLLQGPLINDTPIFGGFGNCGTLVITPTEEFELNGKTYAGKIPTNSVGLMEVLGHESGVLNDAVDDNKGVFTKGTGKGYSRYCEWSGLAHPKTVEDRVPIVISADGKISAKA